MRIDFDCRLNRELYAEIVWLAAMANLNTSPPDIHERLISVEGRETDIVAFMTGTSDDIRRCEVSRSD
jgi:hypothetical protein